MVLQTGEFLLETPQQRLYNPKPRTYKYNIKNSNQRLVQMEKAQEKSTQRVSNLNTREARILGVIIGTLETERESFTFDMQKKQQKFITEDRERKIAHKALQDSLKNGFVALNQFQHSGFRTKVISDMEKNTTPSKLRKQKLQKLSRKSFLESQEIGRRNTQIFNQRFPGKDALTFTPITEAKLVNAELEPKSTPKTVNRYKHPARKTMTLKSSNVKMPRIVPDTEGEDSYDEGGFTPRPRPASAGSLITRLPEITGGKIKPTVFITAGGGNLV